MLPRKDLNEEGVAYSLNGAGRHDEGDIEDNAMAGEDVSSSEEGLLSPEKKRAEVSSTNCVGNSFFYL